jgi:hypothetical protein
MPYVATADLQDLINPAASTAAAREMAEAGLDAFQANVRRRTPVDTDPFRDRPGRPRGFARASVERTRVRRVVLPTGPAYRGEVFSDDDVFPFIEFDTLPHDIRPRVAGRALRWRDRRTGDERFAAVVHHPGTRGQHPFSIGALVTEAELEEVCRLALVRWERAVTRAAVRSVDRRAR